MFGCRFHECYGTSEVGIVSDLGTADGDHRDGSVGRALPTGQVGEIVCRTKTAFSRYLYNPRATAESLAGGYFHTGDLRYLDDAGYLYLSGRRHELIIVGGINVYPQDVEAVLGDCPGVRECAVIGVEDPYFGEAVLAVLVGEGGVLDIHAIRRACAAELADYQQPMAYEVIDALPRNELGKVMKPRLRERFAGYDATAPLRRLMDY
ncbi:MAG: fatty acid--CoA ligase family protein [Candidatus Sedimenticola endophacoides]